MLTALWTAVAFLGYFLKTINVVYESELQTLGSLFGGFFMGLGVSMSILSASGWFDKNGKDGK